MYDYRLSHIDHFVDDVPKIDWRFLNDAQLSLDQKYYRLREILEDTRHKKYE